MKLDQEERTYNNRIDQFTCTVIITQCTFFTAFYKFKKFKLILHAKNKVAQYDYSDVILSFYIIYQMVLMASVQ